MPEISISTSVYPTEDVERISNAIMNLFPDAKIEIESDRLMASSDNLEYLVEKIGEQQIRDSTRRLLREAVKKPGLVFHINKQAALVGKINFTEGTSILGDIDVSISTQDPEELIQQMTGNEENE